MNAITSNQTTLLMILSGDRKLRDLQDEFSHLFPFLRMGFEPVDSNIRATSESRAVARERTLKQAGLRVDGILEITPEVRVGDLETIFFRDYGLNMNISRRSGKAWLQTTMTRSWTLAKQNKHGRETSELAAEPCEGCLDCGNCEKSSDGYGNLRLETTSIRQRPQPLDIY